MRSSADIEEELAGLTPPVVATPEQKASQAGSIEEHKGLQIQKGRPLDDIKGDVLEAKANYKRDPDQLVPSQYKAAVIPKPRSAADIQAELDALEPPKPQETMAGKAVSGIANATGIKRSLVQGGAEMVLPTLGAIGGGMIGNVPGAMGGAGIGTIGNKYIGLTPDQGIAEPIINAAIPGVVGAAGKVIKPIIKNVIDKFPETKQGIVDAVAAAKTALNKIGVDKATELIGSKVITKDITDMAYDKVAQGGNPRIYMKPLIDQLKDLRVKNTYSDGGFADESLEKTIKEELARIQKTGSIPFSDARIMLEKYGRLGYQGKGDSAMKSIHGAIEDSLDASAKVGGDMTAKTVADLKSAQKLYKQKLGSDELQKVLAGATPEKAGDLTLNKDRLINAIRTNKRIAKSFPEAERNEMMEALRGIDLGAGIKGPVTKPSGWSDVLASAGGAVGTEVLHATGFDKTAGAVGALTFLLGNPIGRQMLIKMAAKGPVVQSVFIPLAEAVSSGGQALLPGRNSSTTNKP